MTTESYLDNWDVLVEFVEQYEHICEDVFFDSELARELGKHKALAFYEDGERFVKWIGEMIPESHRMGYHLSNAWEEFIRDNEEFLPALES